MSTPITRRAAGLLASLALARPAWAQNYPSRPVRLVVPFPPGNMSDLIARVLAKEMSSRLGQTVVVDNRAGATGAIGIQAVARSAPDGYTLLLSSNSPLVVNPAVTRDLPFDVQRDLSPIGLIGWTGFLFIVPRDLPARTLAEAVALFRASPGKYIAANPGAGTFGHLVTEQFFRATGVRMEQVPYKGSGQAILDMQAGRVHFMVDAMTSALPQVQGERVRALAILANSRSPLAPDIPTLAESGMPELGSLAAVGWAGLLAPAQTPPEVTAYWGKQLNALLGDPAFVQALALQNVEAAPPGPPADLGDLVARELKRFTSVAHEAGIELSN